MTFEINGYKAIPKQAVQLFLVITPLISTKYVDSRSFTLKVSNLITAYPQSAAILLRYPQGGTNPVSIKTLYPKWIRYVPRRDVHVAHMRHNPKNYLGRAVCQS